MIRKVDVGNKLNFDGVVFSDNLSLNFGAIIRNDRGEVMLALNAKGPHVRDAEEVKILNCGKVLLFAIETGFYDLIIEGDSNNVISKLFLPNRDYSRLGHILQEIKTLVAGFRKRFFSCVNKSGNYSLAKFSKSIFDDVIWIEDSPPLAIEDLFFDVNFSLL